MVVLSGEAQKSNSTTFDMANVIPIVAHPPIHSSRFRHFHHFHLPNLSLIHPELNEGTIKCRLRRDLPRHKLIDVVPATGLLGL